MHTAYQILNSVFHLLIDLDPDTKQKLRNLEGKVVCIKLHLPMICFYLIPDKHGITITENNERNVDVTLTGTLSDFFYIGTKNRKNGRQISGGHATIIGDAETGQAFQQVLSQLDLDLEALLSKATGDILARKIGNITRSFGNWVNQSLALSKANIGDFLKEEKQWVITPLSMERFEKAVDQLRSDTDRLEKRIDTMIDLVSQRSNINNQH